MHWSYEFKLFVANTKAENVSLTKLPQLLMAHIIPHSATLKHMNTVTAVDAFTWQGAISVLKCLA